MAQVERATDGAVVIRLDKAAKPLPPIYLRLVLGSFIQRVNPSRRGALRVAANLAAMPQLPGVNPQPCAPSSVFGGSAHPLLRQMADCKASDRLPRSPWIVQCDQMSRAGLQQEVNRR